MGTTDATILSLQGFLRGSKLLRSSKIRAISKSTRHTGNIEAAILQLSKDFDEIIDISQILISQPKINKNEPRGFGF